MLYFLAVLIFLFSLIVWFLSLLVYTCWLLIWKLWMSCDKNFIVCIMHVYVSLRQENKYNFIVLRSNLFLFSWIGLDGSFFSFFPWNRIFLFFLLVLFFSSMLNFANSLFNIYLEVLDDLCISKLLAERTYTAPSKWMRGKGRVTIQFGCCYNYATVSFSSQVVYQSWFIVGFS